MTAHEPARTRLVLVHGSRLSHTQWAPQVSRIAADRDCAAWLDVVTPDLPGHGARSTEPFTLERAVGAVAAAVEAVAAAVESGPPRADGPARRPGTRPDGAPSPVVPVGRPARVVLAGHSLGGYVAATYAATFPRRLDGLVLLGCAAVPRGLGAAAYRGLAALTERLGPERMTWINDRVLGRFYPADLVAPVVAGGYWFEVTRAAWLEVMARCGPWQLREVACPVLVAGGAYDQLMVDARRYARAASRATVRRVPRAGHFVGFDQPEAVTRLLVDFARSVSVGDDGNP